MKIQRKPRLILLKSLVRVRAYTTGKGTYHTAHDRHLHGGGKEDPNRFVKAPDGNLDFGELPKDVAQAIRRQAGKIRLQLGRHSGKNQGYGVVHIMAEHPEISDITGFVSHVVSGYNEIWRSKKGKIMLVRRGDQPKAPVAIIELQPHAGGEFYSVVTAFTHRKSRGEELLWPVAQSQTPDSGVPSALTPGYADEASGTRANAERKETKDSMSKSMHQSRESPMNSIILLFKSLIPAHTRRLKTGKVVNVRQYTDKRTKRTEDDQTLDMFADDDTITTPRKDMIDEHKRLVDVLESPSRKDDKAEAKKQKEELEEYEGRGEEPSIQDQIKSAKRRLASAKDEDKPAIEKEIRALRNRALDDDPIVPAKPSQEASQTEPSFPQGAQRKAEHDAMAARHGEHYANGYWAKRDGYRMEPPFSVRKKADQNAWERGWLAAKGESDAKPAPAPKPAEAKGPVPKVTAVTRGEAPAVDATAIGQRVTLARAKHSGYVGMAGHVAAHIKSRGTVKIALDNGEYYEALPANIDALDDGVTGAGYAKVQADKAKREAGANRREERQEQARIEAEKQKQAAAKIADRVTSVLPGVPESDHKKVMNAVQRARRGNAGAHVVVSHYGAPFNDVQALPFKTLEAAQRYVGMKKEEDLRVKGTHGVFSPRVVSVKAAQKS